MSISMLAQMNTYYKQGFTLVEMAIVLMIVGLLLGGLLVPLSAQMEQRNVTETRKQLDEIQQALMGFAITTGRLPQPSCGTIPTGQINAGTELSAASAVAIACTNDLYVLPWATLGVSETDAWGNRYTYRVTSIFSDAIGTTFGCATPAPPQASFALCSVGDLYVYSAASGVAATVSSNVPAVIISHGKNGAGAYTQQGIKLPVGNDLDEQDNSDGNTNNKYVSHTPTPTFDDLVIWISPNILLNRMVVAGKLP